MQLNGAARLSGILLAVGIVAYVLLVAVYAWRLAAYPAELRADAANPRRFRRAVPDMKRYTFQALVTLHGGDGDPAATLCSAPRRMVLRGRNEESGRSQIFTALVSCDDEKPFRPGSPRYLATLRLAGDDVADYLSIGGHFDLWLGSTVGDGIVTRRLFV